MTEEQDNNKEQNTVVQDNMASRHMDTGHLTEGCTLIHSNISDLCYKMISEVRYGGVFLSRILLLL